METSNNIVEISDLIREQLKVQETSLRSFVDHIKQQDEAEGFEKGECIAQAMLAMRHIEDARMRVGKVIQYADGGESVYDKK